VITIQIEAYSSPRCVGKLVSRCQGADVM